MKFSHLFAGALLLALSPAFSVEDAPKKSVSKSKGGFVGATPKPDGAKISEKFSEDSAPAKKKAAADSEATPAPRKKRLLKDDEEAPAAKKKAEVPAESEATPVPKKRRQRSEDGEEAAAPKKKVEISADGEKTEPKEPVADATAEKPTRAPAAVLTPEELSDFSNQPPRVQQLITAALELTPRNLTYTYGSDDPARGGMDCSGTMAYVLRGQGFADVPRDSSGQYIWARKKAEFFAVVGKSAESFEFKDLQPGDLLFWTGTYETGREVPISHVMLYLGEEKKTGKRVMFGASDGRSYNGIQRWGVSVFDFKMPRADAANPEKSKVDFVGYARIPGLRAELPAESAPAVPEEETPSARADSTDQPKASEETEPRKKPPTKTKRTTKKADL